MPKFLFDNDKNDFIYDDINYTNKNDSHHDTQSFTYEDIPRKPSILDDIMNNRIDNEYNYIFKNQNSSTSVDKFTSSITDELNERLANFRKKYKIDRDIHICSPKIDSSLNIRNKNNNSTNTNNNTDSKISSSNSFNMNDLKNNTYSLNNDENKENQVNNTSICPQSIYSKNFDETKIHNTIHNHLKIPSFNHTKLTSNKKSSSSLSIFKNTKSDFDGSNSFIQLISNENFQIKDPSKDLKNQRNHPHSSISNSTKKDVLNPNDGINDSHNISTSYDRINNTTFNSSSIFLSKKINLHSTKKICKKIFKYSNQKKLFKKVTMVSMK